VLPAVLGTFLLLACVASTSPAQTNNLSGSSHATNAAPFTGSVAPRTGAVAPPTGAAFIHNGPVTNNFGVTRTHVPHSPSGTHNAGSSHPRHTTVNGTAYYPYVYALPVPYAVDVANADQSNDEDNDNDANYQGGPTIFDRRGSGADSYIPPSSSGPGDTVEIASAQAPEADETPQPPTTLVFKDGHQIEVGNYAIVSQTLYDLTVGHPRKIALGDLDIPATQKQNDDHGVVFQLPPGAQAN
jgi:hypothetical protein